MATQPAQNRFQKLIDDISRLYVSARKAQVQFAWETGKRIVEEEQNGQMRARYGTRLIPELSGELSKKHGGGFSTRTLEKMRQFYKFHPISPLTAKLGWTDYMELMPVRDAKARRQLERRIVTEGLKSVEIRQEVRRFKLKKQKSLPAAKPTEKSLSGLKRPAGLKLHTFAVSKREMNLEKGSVLLDCGFFVMFPVLKSALKKLNVTDTMSYTYEAVIERVVDGDTLLVLVKVGFGIVVEERLRLRGIDCPEMATPEGKRAKGFVSRNLPVGSTVIVRTQKYKTDIYGRFVADVLFAKGVTDPQAIIDEGIYLNQLLIDEGLAVRREW